MRENTYDTVVCAGAPGFKLGANELNSDLSGRETYDDTSAVDSLMNDITQNVQLAHDGLFVLISTISVYAVTSLAQIEDRCRASEEYAQAEEEVTQGCTFCLDERRHVWRQGQTDKLSKGGLTDSLYGRNRARLELFVMQRFPNHLILRLPGIFGANMRKNFIYDLCARSEWRFKIDLNTSHQWYALKYLLEDIRTVLRRNCPKRRHEEKEIRVLNLFAEPLVTRDIVRALFSDQLSVCADTRSEKSPFVDDVRTCFGSELVHYTLLSYTPFLHVSRTLLSYTPPLHFSHPLLSSTPLLHSPLIHSSHTLLSYTLLSYTPKAAKKKEADDIATRKEIERVRLEAIEKARREAELARENEEVAARWEEGEREEALEKLREEAVLDAEKRGVMLGKIEAKRAADEMTIAAGKEKKEAEWKKQQAEKEEKLAKKAEERNMKDLEMSAYLWKRKSNADIAEADRPAPPPDELDEYCYCVDCKLRYDSHIMKQKKAPLDRYGFPISSAEKVRGLQVQ
jgi:hypothetical protein